MTGFFHEQDPKNSGTNIVCSHSNTSTSDLTWVHRFGVKFVCTLLGLLILVIAWVNYINLSTVRHKKKKIRRSKVLGASVSIGNTVSFRNICDHSDQFSNRYHVGAVSAANIQPIHRKITFTIYTQ
jgi:hypothetical protein